MRPHDLYTRRILLEIERRPATSQRALSRRLGIALGLTNLLLRRIVSNGWATVRRRTANRVAYVITAAGLVEKARLTHAYMEDALHVYAETRARVRERLDDLSARWSADDLDGDGRKTIVFYGAGEIAEIAYVGLQDTDLHLVGVVDDGRTRCFFGCPIYAPESLGPQGLNGTAFGRLIVTSLGDGNAIRRRLESLGVPPERVYFIGSGDET